MCGIIGYTGVENSIPILLSGLHSLEYRGYDSSGISVFKGTEIVTLKAKGRISEVEALISEKESNLTSTCGIGHTRWATHGEPSDINSHPHCTENMSLVHNGIIENYIELKEILKGEGYDFISETDTEVALKLIDSKYKELKNPVMAIRSAISEMKGSYAFGIIFKDYPGRIYSTKKDSPLLVAVSESGNFIASDIPAVLKYTSEFYRVEAGEIAVLDNNKVTFYDDNDNEIEKQKEKVDWSYDTATKAGFDHFMLKEIHDEPDSIIKTTSSRISDGQIDFEIKGLDERILNCNKIHIVACGTAMHAGLIGKYFIEKFARIPVEVEIASEFRYKNPILNNNDIFIVISQSGETADTLAALRLAKEKGLYTLSIVNVVGSTVARESDDVIYTYAGPEIAVASTKAYLVQCGIMCMLASNVASIKGLLSKEQARELSKNITFEIPEAIKKVLEKSSEIEEICKQFVDCENLFFIGRGIDYNLACEASLKLKEISYIHCEAYAAGELKHGTISLITENTNVVAIVTEKDLFAKTLSNIKEVYARGARVTILCDETIEIPQGNYNNIIRVPHIDRSITCFPIATAFQMFAYYISLHRGCDIDKPRNLAKSVTVE